MRWRKRSAMNHLSHALPESESEADAASLPARRLVALGYGLLVAMPLAMWAANRSAPLVLALAAAAFLGAASVSAQAGALPRRMAAALTGPIGLAILGFLIWALLSTSWSHRPAAGLAMWGELVLPLACGLAIAATGLFRPGPAFTRALALAIVAAGALITIELASGLSQRIALGIGKQHGFIFNRPAICCLVLAVPVLHLSWTRPAATRLDRALGAAAALMICWIAAYADSGATSFGFIVVALVWLLATVAPRLTLGAVRLGFVVAMLAAPVLGQLADGALPPALHQRLAQTHSRERVDIWIAFGEAALAKPLFGSGFNASAKLETHPVAAQVSEDRRWLLAVGHPHSEPLQTWVETGLIGVLFQVAAGLALLGRLGRLPPRDRAPPLALFAGAFAIACLAHGAWQGWWIAVLVVPAIWFAADWRERRRDDEKVEHG